MEVAAKRSGAAEEAAVPSTSAPSHLKVGTEVKVVRRAGALYGTVASEARGDGRVQVQYRDGGTYYARPEALRVLEQVCVRVCERVCIVGARSGM
jgi:hypothetical protein